MVDCLLRDIDTLNELMSKINNELPKHHQQRVERFKQKAQPIPRSSKWRGSRRLGQRVCSLPRKNRRSRGV